MADFRGRAGGQYAPGRRRVLTRQNPGGGQTAGQSGGAVPPPAHPLAAFVYPDGSMEELQPPGAAAFLGATPPLVGYALAHAESATLQARFFWQHSPGRWVRVDLDRAPPDSPGQAVLVTVTPIALPAGLTPRELDVLTLMACGLSNTEIAGRLHSSSRTVSTHVEHVLGKLGQASRAGAAGVAADRGYLRLPVPGSGALRPASADGGRPAGAPRVGPPAAADRLGLPAARSRPPRRAGDGQRLGSGRGGDQRLRRDRRPAHRADRGRHGHLLHP